MIKSPKDKTKETIELSWIQIYFTVYLFFMLVLFLKIIQDGATQIAIYGSEVLFLIY